MAFLERFVIFAVPRHFINKFEWMLLSLEDQPALPVSQRRAHRDLLPGRVVGQGLGGYHQGVAFLQAEQGLIEVRMGVEQVAVVNQQVNLVLRGDVTDDLIDSVEAFFVGQLAALFAMAAST